MKKQEIFINFGGFYNSIHESQIDFQIEAYQDSFEIEALKIDYDKTQINYSKEYLKKLEQFLFNEKIEVNNKIKELKLLITNIKSSYPLLKDCSIETIESFINN